MGPFYIIVIIILFSQTYKLVWILEIANMGFYGYISLVTELRFKYMHCYIYNYHFPII